MLFLDFSVLAGFDLAGFDLAGLLFVFESALEVVELDALATVFLVLPKYHHFFNDYNLKSIDTSRIF